MHLVDAQKAIQQFAATGARYLLTNAAVPEAHKLQGALPDSWMAEASVFQQPGA